MIADQVMNQRRELRGDSKHGRRFGGATKAFCADLLVNSSAAYKSVANDNMKGCFVDVTWFTCNVQKKCALWSSA